MQFNFQFGHATVHICDWLLFTAVWCVITLVVFFFCDLYNSIWFFASVDELFHIIGSCAVLAAVGVLYLVLGSIPITTSVYVSGAVFSFIGMSADPGHPGAFDPYRKAHRNG